MPETTTLPLLAPDAANQLVAFARTFKAAARAVSLYPPEHPAIEACLARLAASSADITRKGRLNLFVVPGGLIVEGRLRARPDAAIAELATLLHDHLVGQLTVAPGVDAGSWRKLLALLALDPQEVRIQGGIERSWTTAGGHGITLVELDYASLIKERETGDEASWDTIIASCLRADALELDEETLKALAEIAADGGRLAEFFTRFEEQAGMDADVHSRAVTLTRILAGVMEYISRTNPAALDRTLQNMAHAATRLSPEVMMQLLGEARTPGSDHAHVVAEVTIRMTDPLIARFIARSVATEHGCTERLAEAFRALAPDPQRQQKLVDLARHEAQNSALGAEPDFDNLWSHVSDLLLSYSDHAWVSEAYNVELTTARSHALEVENVPDDPPERISAWLTSVSDAQLRALDVELLCDLLRVESHDDRWQETLDLVVRHVDDLALVGDFVSARRLVEGLTAEASREDGVRNRAANAAIELLVRGELMPQVASQLNSIDEGDVAHVTSLCLAIGPRLIPRLADTLAAEQRPRSRQRLTDLLMAYGEHGRYCVDQLRRSRNPSVRRTAVQLLRSFGGQDALSDLAELLHDGEAHVRREAVRALIAIAVDEAYVLLERALSDEEAGARTAVMQELSTTRDERAIPLFCYMLRHLECRGKTRDAYLKAVSRLGTLGGPAAVEALAEVLDKGAWWPPFSAQPWQAEAAAALASMATSDARAALEAAAQGGSFGVRRVARRYLQPGLL